MKHAALWIALGMTLAPAAGMAQSISVTIPVPSIDRWNYPFASQPGTEASIPTFAALRQSGFDDRDAQFLIGFSTADGVPTGFGATRYAIAAADVTIPSDHQSKLDTICPPPWRQPDPIRGNVSPQGVVGSR